MSKDMKVEIEEVVDLIWTTEEEDVSPFSHYPGCGCTGTIPIRPWIVGPSSLPPDGCQPPPGWW